MSQVSMLQAALWYARHHIPVFPCKPRGKEPLTPHGFMDATTEEAKIREWWTKTPGANIGMPTGAASGLLVLDVDPRNGGEESLEKLIATHGRLPETAEQITGGGGRHFAFKHPSREVPCKAFTGGLDLKGDGGYVVIAPSIHPSGNAYLWDGIAGAKALLAPAPAPAWLLELSANGHGRAAPIPEKIPDGKKHDTCVSLAGTMRRRGCEADEITAALVALSARFETPVPAANLRKIAESVCRYPPAAPPPTAPKQPAPRALRVLGAAELWGKKMRQVNWTIDGLLPRGLHILAGRPKEGKSYFSLQLALSVARGEPVFRNRPSFKSSPGRAIYFDLEGSERLAQKRLHELLADNTRLPFLDYCFELGKLTETGAAELAGILEQTSYNLVIIDTLSACIQSGGQRSDIFRAEYAELALLRELSRKHDCCIVVVHHTRKAGGGESPLDAVSGTTARTAATDGVLTLTRGTGGARLLHVVHRESEPLDLALGFFAHGEPGWTLLGDAEAVRRSQERDAVLNLLIESAPEGAATGRMQPKDVAEALRKNAGAVRVLLMKMARDGEVVRHGDGTYSALLSPRQAGSLEG